MSRSFKQKRKPDQKTVTVMFVEQTVGGVLAKRLQMAEDRLAGTTGNRVRITETSGSCQTQTHGREWTVCAQHATHAIRGERN